MVENPFGEYTHTHTHTETTVNISLNTVSKCTFKGHFIRRIGRTFT